MMLHEVLPTPPEIAFSTSQKYRYRLSLWRRMNCAQDADQITPEEFAAFRERAIQDGRKASTINATVRDIAALVQRAGLQVDTGKSLRENIICKHVPENQQISRAYDNASLARWPNCEGSKTERLLRVSNEQFWRSFLIVEYFTGMRLEDLHVLKWVNVLDSYIEIEAKKTGKLHQWPMHPVLRQHLEPLRAIGADTVFGMPKFPFNRIRRELLRIGGIGVNPQALRRASITTWTEMNDTCRAIVHGSGLGVTVRYVDQLRILKKHYMRFPFPVSSLPADLRDSRLQAEAELMDAVKLLPSDMVEHVLKVARAFAT